jgi:hypothetical protein
MVDAYRMAPRSARVGRNQMQKSSLASDSLATPGSAYAGITFSLARN